MSKRTLQHRTNNGYDSILLVSAGTVIGAWTAGERGDELANFAAPGDLDHWDETRPECTDPEEYGELVAEVTGTHEIVAASDYLTTATDASGQRREALQLPWSVVEQVLGRPHDGDAADDAALLAALHVAPAWVADADGWVDESGWGLYGPALADLPDDL